MILKFKLQLNSNYIVFPGLKIILVNNLLRERRTENTRVEYSTKLTVKTPRVQRE
jgi:hypothetical protein